MANLYQMAATSRGSHVDRGEWATQKARFKATNARSGDTVELSGASTPPASSVNGYAGVKLTSQARTLAKLVGTADLLTSLKVDA